MATTIRDDLLTLQLTLAKVHSAHHLDRDFSDAQWFYRQMTKLLDSGARISDYEMQAFRLHTEQHIDRVIDAYL